MRNQKIIFLESRGILRLGGADAESFLQGLVTQDVEKLRNNSVLLYSALLTPQGNILHDFFMFRKEDAIFLDCEHARRKDLLHRLGLYRLRASVSIEDVSTRWRVYAATGKEGCPDSVLAFDDPRQAGIAYQRLYAESDDDIIEAEEISSSYDDACITAGLALGARTFIPEKDIAADMNLDFLHAIAWDKGCYVGQEVTARVRFRGLVKKRLMIAEGAALLPGDRLLQDGGEVGEIRTVASDGKTALAVTRISALENKNSMITDLRGRLVQIVKPGYLQ